jgi:hypothetical protein
MHIPAPNPNLLQVGVLQHYVYYYFLASINVFSQFSFIELFPYVC